MMLAVVDDDANILQRKACHGAFDQRLPHALLDCRNELARDRAPDDFINELESLAALQRLDSQKDLAELPGTACLLLVTAVAVGGPGNSFPVGDARWMRLDVHTVPLCHSLEQHAQMELTHAVQNRLI